MKTAPLRVHSVGGGSPKMPPAEQRRGCTYRSLERILCFGSLSLGSCAVWAIELVEKLGLPPPWYFWGVTPRVRCAMVCRRGRGWCPGRHSLRFTIYRISCGRRQSSNSRRISSGALAQCEHATSSWINSSNSIRSNSKEVSLDFFFNWIEKSFTCPTMKMSSWLLIFLPIRSKFNPIQFKKLNWISFFFAR